MRRQDKYPDTKHFKFHNSNPKNKYTTDCVIRALSTALNKDYNTVVIDLAQLQCKLGVDVSDPKLYNKYLEQNGWSKCKQPRQPDGTKMTGKEFCELLQFWKHKPAAYNRIIAHIGSGHIVAIINGQILDTWNSSEGCIGNFWIEQTLES